MSCRLCELDLEALEREADADANAKPIDRRCQLHRAFAGWASPSCERCGWPQLLHGRDCEAL
jgi:hypothetical protein